MVHLLSRALTGFGYSLKSPCLGPSFPRKGLVGLLDGKLAFDKGLHGLRDSWRIGQVKPWLESRSRRDSAIARSEGFIVDSSLISGVARSR